MHAEIIAIGDEITSGQSLDTNSQWLSQRLEELGIRVLYHSTVGDELQPCTDVFRRAIERSDLVVVTGGLGPTADDLTRESLALAAGRPLQLDPEAQEYIRAIFARRKRPMPKQNELQAMFPAGSRVVRNPHGTAPGIDLEVPRAAKGDSPVLVDNRCATVPAKTGTVLSVPCRVICLPGVPAEMVEMWHDSVAASIVASLGSERRVICRRLIHCFGAGESQIESMLPDLIRRGRQPTVGITASKATITLRIAAEGTTEQECLAAMEPTVATMRQCLGNLVFGEGEDELQDAVVRLLRERKKTLATVECATAGLVAQCLAGVEGAADVYRGGVVITETAEPADVLATRCREQFAADFGLAIGPFSSPSAAREAGGEGDQPQTVTFALASSTGVQQKTIPTGIYPALLQIYLAKQAINILRLALLDRLSM